MIKASKIVVLHDSFLVQKRPFVANSCREDGRYQFIKQGGGGGTPSAAPRDLRERKTCAEQGIMLIGFSTMAIQNLGQTYIQLIMAGIRG